MNTTTNTRGVSEAMVAELIAAGDFLAMNGTDGMVRRWEKAKAALSAPEPAAPHFPDANALADWLESLHECHTGGAVGNRKWEAAQIAAKAVRGAAQPAERVPDSASAWISKAIPLLKAAASWMPTRKCAAHIREIDALLATAQQADR